MEEARICGRTGAGPYPPAPCLHARTRADANVETLRLHAVCIPAFLQVANFLNWGAGHED
eukprot:6193607-Pleurochrysis_carterae.AAC.1